MTFFLKRLGHAAFLLAGVSVLSFLLLQLAPGDFFDEMRLNPQISPQTISHLRSQFGMDKSLPVRYWRWLRSAAHGDFGYSFAYNVPVSPLLRTRALNTVLLAGVSTLVAWIIALAIGVWNATRAGRWPDRLSAGVFSFSLAVPDVLVALLALSRSAADCFPSADWSPAASKNLAFCRKLGTSLGIWSCRSASWLLD